LNLKLIPHVLRIRQTLHAPTVIARLGYSTHFSLNILMRRVVIIVYGRKYLAIIISRCLI
jgi:hypothetical protein